MLHLRAIHSADHSRSDMRVTRRIRENTTEELRSEMDNVHPILRWPVRKKLVAVETSPKGI